MPIRHAIWKVAGQPAALPLARLESEKQLEDMIVAAPEILGSDWMLIGRQEITEFGGRIDLLAIAPDGELVLIELKRDKTPREIVAQSLDYASWVEKLKPEKISQIYGRFKTGGNLKEDFRKRFGTELSDEELNQSHQIIIVAAELDEASERIVAYLNERGLPINVIFFQVFRHGDSQLISRTWMIDPGETQVKAAAATTKSGENEPWNGEYYASFGHGLGRDWTEARKYGFICAGGGTWYTNTLRMLSPGDRIWVNIPKKGYVGVGIVQCAVKPAAEFILKTEAGDRPALEVLKADYHRAQAEDSATCEYFVPVVWLDSVPVEKAVREIGFFGNQNSVCRPTTPDWRHTVDRLKTYFKAFDHKASGPQSSTSIQLVSSSSRDEVEDGI